LFRALEAGFSLSISNFRPLIIVSPVPVLPEPLARVVPTVTTVAAYTANDLKAVQPGSRRGTVL